MKKRSVEIYDSDISYNSLIKKWQPIQSSHTIQNDKIHVEKDISKDLKNHFKSSKIEHLNDTLNDILMSMMRKEEKILDFSRNRESILHNIQVKNIEKARNSSTKARRRNSSIDCQQSQMKNMSNINSLRNSCERSRKNLYINNSPNSSIATNRNNKSFYEREMINLEKKKLEIEAIKNQRRAEEMIINTNRPKLSQNSLRIINEKFKLLKPVYMRTADIMQMKKIEESKLLQKYLTKEVTEVDDSSASRQKTPVGKKNLESGDSPVTRWLKKMELYNAKHEKKKEKIKLCSEKATKEAESFTFKPVISKTSELLAGIRLSSDGNNLNKSTHERLHIDKENRSKKLDKLIDDNMPSFSPIINRNKQNYFYNGKISRRSLPKYLTQNEVKEKNQFDKTKSATQREIEQNKNNLKNSNVNLSEVIFTDFDVREVGYKINIRNYSAWVKEKENKIILSKAIPSTLKSLYLG